MLKLELLCIKRHIKRGDRQAKYDSIERKGKYCCLTLYKR